MSKETDFFVHPTAVVDEGAEIGPGSKIWHFCHVMTGAVIGANCVLGQNVVVGSRVVIGDNVKIQNNVSVYEGVELESDVFCGPSCVFTNDSNPRSEFPSGGSYEGTLVRCGATLGANCTVVCGNTIGRYAFVGAGAVITSAVPDYALMLGVPARRVGWMSRHGYRLEAPNEDGVLRCQQSGLRYRESVAGVLECLDEDEETPLLGAEES